MMPGPWRAGGLRIAALVTAIGLVSCLTQSEGPFTYRAEANEPLLMVIEAERMAESDPESALEKLDEAMSDERMTAFRREYGEYVEALSHQLQRIASTSDAQLDLEGASGLPMIYHRRYETLGRAYVARARVLLALGRSAAASSICEQGLRDLDRPGPTPFLQVRFTQQLQTTAAEAARAQGLRARAEVAQLNADLLGDVLDSDAGAELFYVERSAAYGKRAWESWANAVHAIRQANVRRYQEHQAMVQQINAAMVAAGAQVNQAMLDAELKKTGGQETPRTRALRRNQQMFDIMAEIAGAHVELPDLSAFLRSPASGSILKKLLAAGKSFARERIMDFLSSTKDLVPGLREMGDQLLDAVEELERLGLTAGELSPDKIKRFAADLSAYLERLVEQEVRP